MYGMEIEDSILKMLKPQAHTVELWDTQAPTPCDSVSAQRAFNRRGFPNGQPSIYQGNQIYGFSCPAFETGTT